TGCRAARRRAANDRWREATRWSWATSRYPRFARASRSGGTPRRSPVPCGPRTSAASRPERNSRSRLAPIHAAALAHRAALQQERYSRAFRAARTRRALRRFRSEARQLKPEARGRRPEAPPLRPEAPQLKPPAAQPRSSRPPPEEHRLHRVEADRQVEEERLVLHVI